MRKSICFNCKYSPFCNNAIMREGDDQIIMTACSRFKGMPKLTNADRIRSMTDEELAEWIAYRQGCFERQDKRCSKYGTCRDCWFDWLKEEATP